MLADRVRCHANRLTRKVTPLTRRPEMVRVFLTASGEEPMVNTTLRDAFDRWKGALIDQDKQTTKAARHRAHARVTSMEDLIAETPAASWGYTFI